jgi:hypothetical protein
MNDITYAPVTALSAESITASVYSPVADGSAQATVEVAPVIKSEFNQQITDLPSKFITYDFDSLNVRRFRPRDLSKLYQSARNEDFTIMIKVVGSTIDQDINVLTIPDFYYLMYWHRLHSYPNSPFEVKWRSKYGSDEIYTITKDNLVVNPIKISPEGYASEVGLGLRIPTVADLIDIQARKDTKTDDDTWLIDRAQFLQGDSLEEKLNTLDDMGVEFLEHMRGFGEATEHGVEEDLKVCCSQTYTEAVANLKQLIAAGEPGYEPILDKLVIGKVIEPEDLKLSMSVFQFFPNI